jgi:hypothetical protein
MVAKDENGNNSTVPQLILSDMEEVRRFYDSINRIENKKKYKALEMNFDDQSSAALQNLKHYNVALSDSFQKP